MTGQVHENLILNGENSSMAFCPPLPKNDSRIVELEKDEIIRHGIFSSTACWRQYVGTWEIKDNRFYLVELNGRFNLVGNTPVLADWFTGTLRIPKGKLLHYVHMGYGSVYEFEIHIKIENGIVTKSKTIDNRNKEVSIKKLGWNNLPGFENRFEGDDEL